mmetsp:Transcript_7650/g.15570  ORF Transcript_7650/g.15570 Transcript_7650/m.15570 type:complete len:335 (-) Transcript_7650:1234-2238(-)
MRFSSARPGSARSSACRPRSVRAEVSLRLSRVSAVNRKIRSGHAAPSHPAMLRSASASRPSSASSMPRDSWWQPHKSSCARWRHPSASWSTPASVTHTHSPAERPTRCGQVAATAASVASVTLGHSLRRRWVRRGAVVRAAARAGPPSRRQAVRSRRRTPRSPPPSARPASPASDSWAPPGRSRRAEAPTGASASTRLDTGLVCMPSESACSCCSLGSASSPGCFTSLQPEMSRVVRPVNPGSTLTPASVTLEQPRRSRPVRVLRNLELFSRALRPASSTSAQRVRSRCLSPSKRWRSSWGCSSLGFREDTLLSKTLRQRVHTWRSCPLEWQAR